MAAQGLGLALARARLVADDLASGLLVRPCGEAAVALERAYRLVLPREAVPRQAVGAVTDWIKREAAEQVVRNGW